MRSVSCSDCFNRMTAYRHVRPHKSVPFLDNITQTSTCSSTKKNTHTHTHARTRASNLSAVNSKQLALGLRKHWHSVCYIPLYRRHPSQYRCLLIAGIFIIILTLTATLYQEPELPSISYPSCIYCFHNPIQDSVFAAIRGGADKSLARPGRRQATATKRRIHLTYSPRSSIHFLSRCFNFYKPLKKNSEICPSNQVSAAAMTSASDEKWRPFKCLFSPGNRG